MLVLEEDRQFYHLRCSIIGMPDFLLTSIYALLHSNFRSVLWLKLKSLSTGISMPWVVWGDFNDILSELERIRGATCNQGRIEWFRRQLEGCELVDLGASGPKYTLKGPRIRRCKRLYERLDRALANQSTVSNFPNCMVRVLPRISFLDHNPLLLNMNVSNRGQNQRPFRFEAM
ncbi:hypothetical protein K1719_033905 [Acacia pycnantha]|nr:hypothetical protein K1719_033905 [Acacia pycnantha]